MPGEKRAAPDAHAHAPATRTGHSRDDDGHGLDDGIDPLHALPMLVRLAERELADQERAVESLLATAESLRRRCAQSPPDVAARQLAQLDAQDCRIRMLRRECAELRHEIALSRRMLALAERAGIVPR
jgi:hypothetical protein